MKSILRTCAVTALCLTNLNSATLDPQYAKLVPSDKGLDPAARAALTERDEAPVWRGGQLDYVGMPVSGIGTGQLYLGGDGSLWHWGLFNGDDIWSKCEGYRYLYPSDPADFKPVDQGFALYWNENGKRERRTLDRNGFSDIAFHPRFPLATVEYRDPEVPVTVDLTAFSPYIPLDVARSTYPVTVLDFTLTNTGSSVIEADLGGWIENYSADFLRGLVEGTRYNSVVAGSDFEAVVTSAKVDSANPPGPAERTVFEDFNGDSFEGWTAEGDAFGNRPENYKGKKGRLGGNPDGTMAISMQPDDGQQGTLTSDPFIVAQPFVNMSFAAGRMPYGAGLRLLVGGKVVRSMTGIKPRRLEERSWNVAEFIGREARIQIFDESSEDNGYVVVDTIEFSNRPVAGELPSDLAKAADLGELALAIVRPEGPVTTHLNLRNTGKADGRGKRAEFPLVSRPVAAIGQGVRLAPGESKTVTFLLSWRYPNRANNTVRTYAERWPDIGAQLAAVAAELPQLREQTRLFADTWRDSTLPHWLLDRILIPTAALNTNTVIDTTGRIQYTFLEGSDSLGGNCTHVWHYAQGAARLFPEIERVNRETVELDAGYTRDGQIKYRAGPSTKFMTAMDGTSGTILRILREHQMSTDDAFLKRVWPKTKKAMAYLIDTYDSNGDGITEGWQHNTLDQDWAGDIPWLSSMYLAALRASSEMAKIVGDEAFAARCDAIIAKGRTVFVDRMWNEDFGYFIMKADPSIQRPSPGTYEGAHIDQVLGEWWLGQLGLEPILPEDKTRRALESLFRYNYLPDIGPYREVYTGGRWYAAPGEPGLMMATFPFGGGERIRNAGGAGGYLNENMSGFEWQAAAHMIDAGLVDEGLQVVKALDRRYRPEARNPFNEIECGDHYGRALASHSVLIALSGYRHDGPAGFLAFAPKLTPENFRAPFTAAGAWGTFEQKRIDGEQVEQISVAYGNLNLQTLALEVSPDTKIKSVRATLDGKPVELEFRQNGSEVQVRFAERLTATAGSTVSIRING